MNIISSVTIAIKKDDRFLVVPQRPDKQGGIIWEFPHDEFKENLNGSLDDTAKRVLKRIVGESGLKKLKIDYLGSYLHKKEGMIVIGYDFFVENFKGELIAKDFRWVGKAEIENATFCDAELDQNTLIFLKLNREFL